MLLTSACVYAIVAKDYVMFATFLPVNILNTRIDLSLRTMAMYLPLGLIFMLIGVELKDNNLRNSASILHVYFKFVGKSNVYGSHTSTKALSSIVKHTSCFQSILIAFIGCLWKFNVCTIYGDCSSSFFLLDYLLSLLVCPY